MDFSDGDKLSFSDLLPWTYAATLDDFLNANVSVDLSLQNLNDRTLLFTIQDNYSNSRDVEITFDRTNTAFDQFVQTYNNAADDTAREDAMRSFLQNISGG
ncbi:MAG: hypothetical protein LBU06_02150 [Desulfovibrio sp.]|jgi:hypothetical protein|nr:hypothetical protein [Desulfovibrio sp.]